MRNIKESNCKYYKTVVFRFRIFLYDIIINCESWFHEFESLSEIVNEKNFAC